MPIYLQFSKAGYLQTPRFQVVCSHVEDWVLRGDESLGREVDLHKNVSLDGWKTATAGNTKGKVPSSYWEERDLAHQEGLNYS